MGNILGAEPASRLGMFPFRFFFCLNPEIVITPFPSFLSPFQVVTLKYKSQTLLRSGQVWIWGDRTRLEMLDLGGSPAPGAAPTLLSWEIPENIIF